MKHCRRVQRCVRCQQLSALQARKLTRRSSWQINKQKTKKQRFLHIYNITTQHWLGLLTKNNNNNNKVRAATLPLVSPSARVRQRCIAPTAWLGLGFERKEQILPCCAHKLPCKESKSPTTRKQTRSRPSSKTTHGELPNCSVSGILRGVESPASATPKLLNTTRDGKIRKKKNKSQGHRGCVK